MKNLLMKWSTLIALVSVIVVGCAGNSKEVSLGEYVDDSVITSKVKAELAASDKTSALAIEVDTFKAVVQLSGFVNTVAEKQAASRISKDVPGVRVVENDIIVK